MTNGMPRFNEKEGPFSLAKQFLDFAWDKNEGAFDPGKLVIVYDIVGVAFQRAMMMKDTHLTAEDAEQVAALSAEQRRSVVRRKSLFAAAGELLNIVRFKINNAEKKAPQTVLATVEDNFWSEWKLYRKPEVGPNSWMIRNADDRRLSDGRSSECNHLFITDMVKSLADAAGIPKEGKFTSIPNETDPMTFLMALDTAFFKKLEQRFHEKDGPGGGVRL